MVVPLLLTCFSSSLSISELLLATLEIPRMLWHQSGIHCLSESNILLKIRLRKINSDPRQSALNSSRCYSFLKGEWVGRL